MKMLRFQRSATNPKRVGWWTLCLIDYIRSMILRSFKPLYCLSNNTRRRSRRRTFWKSFVGARPL